MENLESNKREESPEQDYMTRDENGELVPDYDQTIKFFDDGDLVSGSVVRIDRDEVLVDIGYKSEGVIPLQELSLERNANPEEEVSLGDTIETLVLQKEDKDGRLILSKKRAEFEKTWREIARINEEGEGVVEGKVIEVVKGGLMLDIGIKGFLPASLVELNRVRDLETYVGKEITCKIIEMNKRRRNVVLSRKAVLEEERKQEKREILSKIEKGHILTGKVSSIVNFGAFVDLGGIDGLVHISELSWTHVSHPSEVVKVGDEVKIQVLDIDRERARVSLGLKQTQEDFWKDLAKKHSVGDMVEGTVCKIMPFGAFVEIEKGFEGLVHVSELAEEPVEAPNEIVEEGKKVEVKIINIDLNRRRLSLSLKQVQDQEEEETRSKSETSVKETSPKEGELNKEVKDTEESLNEAENPAENETRGEEAEKSESSESSESSKSEEPLLEKKVKVKVEEVELAEEENLPDTEAIPNADVVPEKEDVAEEEVLPEPHSLEDVLEQMKKTRSQR